MSLPHPALFFFFFLFLDRSTGTSPTVGGETVCCFHLILHDVNKMYPDIILRWVFLSFSNCMEADGLVPCCFGDMITVILHHCTVYLY